MARLNHCQIKYQLKDYTHHEFLLYFSHPFLNKKCFLFSLCYFSLSTAISINGNNVHIILGEESFVWFFPIFRLRSPFGGKSTTEETFCNS